MFDHLLESSRWDDSSKWSNIGFGEEIGIIEIKNMHTIWSPEHNLDLDEALKNLSSQRCWATNMGLSNPKAHRHKKHAVKVNF